MGKGRGIEQKMTIMVSDYNIIEKCCRIPNDTMKRHSMVDINN